MTEINQAKADFTADARYTHKSHASPGGPGGPPPAEPTEYPKWVTPPVGEAVIVQDPNEEADVMGVEPPSKLRKAAGALVLLLALLVPGLLSAQTTVTATTLSAAVALPTQGAPALVVQLASATGVSAPSASFPGTLLYVDGEGMRVQTLNGTVATVTRGAARTQAGAHASGSVVYAGPATTTAGQIGSPFVASDPPMGSCTSTNEAYSLRINTVNGAIWSCKSTVGIWVNLRATVQVTCRMLLIADMVDQSCWTADRSYVVYGITEVHKVAEAGGTLTLRPTRETTTQAAASGDLLLATQFNGVGTAETVLTGTLTATPSYLLLSVGDRLGIDFTDDVAGELAGVTVTFTLYPR